MKFERRVRRIWVDCVAIVFAAISLCCTIIRFRVEDDTYWHFVYGEALRLPIITCSILAFILAGLRVTSFTGKKIDPLGRFMWPNTVIVVASVTLFMLVCWRYNGTSAVNYCINNMRFIDGAKAQWALDKKKSPSAKPTEADLMEYISPSENERNAWQRQISALSFRWKILDRSHFKSVNLYG